MPGEQFVQYKNLTVVPSIHYTPEFAGQVRLAFESCRPGAIAVELPQSIEEILIEAVAELPNLVGIINISPRRKLKFLPVIPSDSLIEAVRLALENDIDLHLIDLDHDREIEDGCPFLPDPMLLLKQPLSEYYDCAAPVVNSRGDCEINHLRESTMAAHLHSLMQQNENVLFVCGMAHWQRLRRRLKDRDFSIVDSVSSTAHEIVCIDPFFLEQRLGAIPFDIYCYEQFRQAKEDYSRIDSSLAIYHSAAAIHEYKNPPRRYRQMMQYVRNLEFQKHRLSPTLYHLVLSAKNNVDDRYARDVLETARSYPDYFPEKNRKRLTISGDSLRLGGREVEVDLLRPNENDTGRLGDLEKLKFRKQRRKNPYEDDSDGDYSSDWGRYRDEMKREEQFIRRLEKIAHDRQNADEPRVQEFSSGFADGVSVRETLRFRQDEKVYVRELPPSPEDFDAIIIDYASLQKNSISRARTCYTYGFHKGLGWHSEPRSTGSGTARSKWYYLASFKRAYEGSSQMKQGIEDLMQRFNTTRSFKKSFLQIALAATPGPRILYAGKKYPRELKENKTPCQLEFLPLTKIDESLLRKLQWFNLYYYPTNKE